MTTFMHGGETRPEIGIDAPSFFSCRRLGGSRLVSFFLHSALLFLCLAATAASVKAQGSEPQESDSKEEKKETPVVDEDIVNPRETLLTFFEAVQDGDYDRAIKCIDVSKMERATLRTKKQAFCDKLYVLLHDIWQIDPMFSPAVEDLNSPFTLDSVLGLIESAEASDDAARIKLIRTENLAWKFSSRSVELVDRELYDKWNQGEVITPVTAPATFSMWLESQVPPSLRTTHFLIKDYQWIALLFLMLVGFAVDILTRYLLNFFTNSWFRYFSGQKDFKAKRNLWKPVGLLLNALTWYFGATLIDLPANFLTVLLVALKLFAVFASIWTAFSAVNLLSDRLLEKAERTPSKFDDLLIPFVRNGLKIVSVCVGLVLFVDVFSLNWNSLLGGFGLGGIAIAIASKDVLGNVFGSLTVLTDRPFEIGDWVITEGVEGEVESVGMRSSRIRTFYNSLVVVPNSRLTTAIVDNMGRRRYRRVKATLGVEYGTTVVQLEAFCEGIRELIRQNSETRKGSFHVYVNEFGDSSIDILLYFFLKSRNWSAELQQKHTIFLQILRLADELKIGFAFPTQTLHLRRSNNPTSMPEFDESEPKDVGTSLARKISHGE